LSAVLVVWLSFHWRDSEADMGTVKKPIAEWSVVDVESWVRGLGPWTREHVTVFAENEIDGPLVLALTDRDLQVGP
jgi:arabinogalactan endo-1,4-beta-galactosidase